MRLLPGWLAGQEGRSFTLDGDESIRRRPVDRIAEPLRRMGASIEATDGRLPPFTVHGARLHAIDYELPVASAQVKSCVLLAALMADGATTVVEPAPQPRPHRADARRGPSRSTATATRSRVTNADELRCSSDCVVPGDPSSAAFLIAAGVLVPGSRLLSRGGGVNWTRTGFLRILERMGGIVARRPRGARRATRSRPRADRRPRRRPRPAERHGRRGRRGPAGDRRAAARGAARLLRRGRDGRPRRAGAAR